MSPRCCRRPAVQWAEAGVVPDCGEIALAAPAIPSPANDDDLLRRALEGLLFITDRPLSAAELGKLVGIQSISTDGEHQKELDQTAELTCELMRAAGLNKKQLAERLGWQPSQVTRLFDDLKTLPTPTLPAIHVTIRALSRLAS